jgi:plastocyanin
MSIRQILVWLLALIAVLAILSIAFGVFTTSRSRPVATPLRTPPPVPAFTKERTVKAIGTKSFSLLLSYTDQGFEPKSATVQAGDMVRFVNKSTHPMTISLPGAPADLPPGEYWEFTLDTAGDTSLTEKTSGAQGIIHVR